MSDTFQLTASLPETGITREDFYDLIKTAVPLAGLLNDETLEVVAQQIACSLSVPRWRKYTVDHEDLEKAATTNDILLFTLPAGGVIHACIIKHSVAFTGGAISAYTIGVGVTGTLNKYSYSNFDVFQAVSDTAFQSTFDQAAMETFASAGSEVRIAAASTGADLDAATAGSVDVWVLTSQALI